MYRAYDKPIAPRTTGKSDRVLQFTDRVTHNFSLGVDRADLMGEGFDRSSLGLARRNLGYRK
jgi:hypothetical protein